MAVVDFTTSLRMLGAFWHAASSCIVPMTLISFIAVRPPAPNGVAITLMCTTVSTCAEAMTFAMIGLRMSARTNSVRPTSWRGGTTSTPMTRSMPGSAASIAARRPPRYRETPVMRTTRLSLELFVAIALGGNCWSAADRLLRHTGDDNRVAAVDPQLLAGAAGVDRQLNRVEGVLAQGELAR